MNTTTQLTPDSYLPNPSSPSVAARHGARITMAAADAPQRVALGWHPDIPDFRDRDLNHPEVKDKLKQHKSLITNQRRALPTRVDHRALCSPIENQLTLGSCTAQSVVGLMEYMINKSEGERFDGSRLFIYKVTRKLLGWEGDTGAYLRTAMQAVATFGVPPEKHYPYDINKYEEEPSAFLYSFANNYKALNYARLDPVGSSQADILSAVKRTLAAGFCVVFGFTVYSSLSGRADIPFPRQQDSVNGGHAVMAVGYDDEHKNAEGERVPSLIIRNSWGLQWGEQGYGYLPYDYVLRGLARDFWTSFKWDWLDTEAFA